MLMELERILSREGFIRVDDLRVRHPGGAQERIRSAPGPDTRWDTNNGLAAVAVTAGRVWVGKASLLGESSVQRALEDEGAERGTWVPLSNGEEITSRDLLFRIADPAWNPPY